MPIDPETCPKSDDGQHCINWYDGEQCTQCGAPAAPDCESCDGKMCGHEANCPNDT